MDEGKELFGGSAESVLRLADELRQMGDSVEAGMTRDEIARRLRDRGDQLENAASGMVRAYGMTHGTAA